MFLPGCVGLDAAQELRPISEVLVVAERLEGPRALLAQGEGSPLDHGLVQQAPQSLEGQAGVGLLRLGLLTGLQEADHARRVQQLTKNQALPGQTGGDRVADLADRLLAGMLDEDLLHRLLRAAADAFEGRPKTPVFGF